MAMRRVDSAQDFERWGGHVSVFAAVVAVCVGWAVQPAAQETVDGEFHRLVDIAEGNEHRAHRLAAADLVGELRSYLPAREYVDRLEAAADTAGDPLVEFALRRRAMRAELEAFDDVDDSAHRAFARRQSCLVDWALVGPFPNASMEGFDRQLGPENGMEGPFSGRYSEIDWRVMDDSHHLCVQRVDQRVHPSTSAAAYLATTVEVDQPREATLLVGSRSAYRIWVNGRPVGQRRTGDGLGIDAEGWHIELQPGDNEILVKLASSGQGGLGWVARLMDADEKRVLDDWRAEPGVEPAEVEPFADDVEPDGGANRAIERALDVDRSPSVRLAAATLWKRLYGDDTGTPWRDVADELVDRSDELTAREMVWLARLYEDLWRRLAVLDEAVDRSGDDAYVRWRRAEERTSALSELQQERKRQELGDLVDEYPQFLMARLSLARWYDRRESSARALPIVDGWTDPKRESIPAWVRTAARLHRQAGDQDEAVRLKKRTAELHRLSGTFGRDLLRWSLAAGAFDEADDRIGAYLRRAPWTTTWRLRRALLHESTGDVEDAVSQLDEMIERAPEDPSLRKRRAEFLAASGDEQRAMKAVDEAIALRPQSRSYQQFREHLQPEAARFYEPWRITDLHRLADETDAGEGDYDRLVDQRVQRVSQNGLASRFEQRVERVLRDEGVGGARSMRISYRPGDEQVEVLGVRVLKSDGTISEDYDEWSRSRTRQSARMYNDRAYVNLRANDVDVGDIVEFRYVIHQIANENFRGDYFGDVRYMQRTRPVALARYAVEYPHDLKLYFREPTLEHTRFENRLPDGEPVDDRRITAFEVRNAPRIHTESDQPGHTDIYDYVMVSNKETYDDVARWWWDLIEEQLVVDDEIRAAVADVTEDLDDDEQKLEAIYEYVVRNTRYLHLGLGIHGWKPYRTTTVFRNRYGDCKDKAALLKVMLEEAGIDAEMVLVRTRRLGSVDSFPPSMHIFNHAVTYVPSMDLFLDPTARFNGPYELTSMDQGAQALIVGDDGRGEWLRMPVDDAEDNLLRQTLEVDLRAQTPVVSGRMEGFGREAVSSRRRFEDSERRDERLEDRLRSRFAGLELLEAEYDNLRELTKPAEIRFRAEVPGAIRERGGDKSVYASVAPRDFLDRYARRSTRHRDLSFRVPYARHLEVRFRLPEGAVVERIPTGTHVDSAFGSFETSYDYAGGELTATMRYSIDVQRVAAEDYPEFRRFVAEMDEALNERIALMTSEDGEQTATKSEQ